MLGFNAYMASLMMEVTLCVKEVELGVDETNDTQDNPDDAFRGSDDDSQLDAEGEAGGEAADVANLMQRTGFNTRLLRPGRYEDRDDKFGLLLEAFVVALEKLLEPRRSSSAARMNRQLIQRCGRQGGDLLGNANAEALRAALVVFSGGQLEPLSALAEEWLEYWWTVLTPHLGAEASGSGAGSGDIGDTELSMVDRALQEERDMEEAKRQSREAADLERARAEVENGGGQYGLPGGPSGLPGTPATTT